VWIVGKPETGNAAWRTIPIALKTLNERYGLVNNRYDFAWRYAESAPPSGENKSSLQISVVPRQDSLLEIDLMGTLLNAVALPG